jgi:hypothetical protein
VRGVSTRRIDQLAALAVAPGLVAVEAEEDDAVVAVPGWLERNGRWSLIA